MIKFGTDGWRAVISADFTFEGVKLVAGAVAKYIHDHNLSKKGLIVGYDPRFLSEKFAETVVEVVSRSGIPCFLTAEDTPTPAVAFAVLDKKAAGAVMITASHNPPEYSGIKFIPEYGGPASLEITNQIVSNLRSPISNLKPAPPQSGFQSAPVERFNPSRRYFKRLNELIDGKVIRNAGLKLIYDPMYGSGRNYLGKILQELGCTVEVIHGQRDVLFGGLSPEPDESNLRELAGLVAHSGVVAGIATDGDADRFGAVDKSGEFFDANALLPLMLDYLITVRKLKGAVVRSLATTHLLDEIASVHKMQLYEKPVGFKYIAEVMLKEAVILGGEGSGGMSMLGHVPEKDGILANLLLIEILSKKRKTLKEIQKEIWDKYGKFVSKKIKFKLKVEHKQKLFAELKNKPPVEVGGLKVLKVITLDGYKLVLEDKSWILIRPSGTEPLVCLYAESGDESRVEKLIENAQKMIYAI